jgi:GNAT superfamily N-acetyltransferase
MVEAATLLDIPRLVELGAAMHAESSYAGRDFDRVKVGQLLAALIAGGGVVFVVRRDGEVVGGMAGGVAPQWFGNDLTGFDYGLFLIPQARHGTLALRLIRAFEVWCRIKGAKDIRLGITTGVRPEGTARLYQSAGYSDGGLLFHKEL